MNFIAFSSRAKPVDRHLDAALVSAKGRQLDKIYQPDVLHNPSPVRAMAADTS
jgi:hypothetical protein